MNSSTRAAAVLRGMCIEHVLAGQLAGEGECRQIRCPNSAAPKNPTVKL